MKKILITLFALLAFSFAFAAPSGGPTSITVSQGAINGLLTAVSPLSGTKSINLFSGPQPLTYSISNLNVTIQNGSMPFTGNIYIKTSTISTTATITGTMSVRYDSGSKSIILEMTNINSNNQTVLSLLQTLQAVGMFKIQYPVKTEVKTYSIAQMGSTKKVQSQFSVQNISMQPGNLVLTGNITFQQVAAKSTK